MKVINKLGHLLLKFYQQCHFPVQFLWKMALRSVRRKLFEFEQTPDGAIPAPNHNFLSLHLPRVSAPWTEDQNEVVTYLTEKYLIHEFNLLGSGWQKVDYFTPAKGFEKWNYPVKLSFTGFDEDLVWLNSLIPAQYIPTARELLTEIKRLHPEYAPIDWQRDFISGGRFNGQIRQEKQMSLYKPGMDIKVPWELGRLQHLPQLALCAQFDEANISRLYTEFKCQVLDFMALNPVGYGANWACTMDVGIRTANLCLAMDLFSGQFPEDESWRSKMAEFIYIHARHIAGHLEYRFKISSNHYLANMAGLLFACAHLSSSAETNYWLALSAQEIAQALEWQFLGDGANFEQSTAYHRLSGEMIVWSFALIMGLNDQQKEIIVNFNQLGNPREPKLKSHNFFGHYYPYFIRPDLLMKIIKLGKFAEKIHKPDGEIVQIGDNDSGRFFRLSPKGRFLNNSEAKVMYYNLQNHRGTLQDGRYWDENDLHHGALLAAIEGIFGGIYAQKLTEGFFIERQLVNKLIGFEISINDRKETKMVMGNPLFTEKELKFVVQNSLVLNNLNLNTLELNLFHQFGLLIISNEQFFLSLRMSPKGSVHPSGSHQHMDTASVELWCQGRNLMRDPGTYVYTASLDQRQKFRSSAVHLSPQISGTDPQIIGRGNYWAFNMIDRVKGALVQVSPTRIIYQYRYGRVKVQRTIELKSSEVIILDKSNRPFVLSDKSFAWFSPGYGKLIKLKN